MKGMQVVRARGQVAIALTVAALGFLLATQLRAQQGLAQRLQIERESDLGQILSELSARNDQLVQQISDLRVQLATSAGSQAQQKVLEDEARAQVNALRIMLGLVPVRGAGITLTVSDPQRTIGADIVLDAVQELRDAGAEAIEVGGVRVAVSTSFGGRAGAVTVDGRALGRSFTIAAIGAPDTLAEAMRIPGGVSDTISTRAGASVHISRSQAIVIRTVRSTPTFTYARPRR